MKWPKRQSRLILLGTAICALLLAWLLWPREPVYKGRSLGNWLDQVDLRYATPAAQVAFNRMGPPAVPCLLQRVRDEDSARQKIHRWTWAHLPQSLQARVKAPPSGGRPLYNRIALALSFTGPPAAPSLAQALTDQDNRVRLVSVAAIGMMGARAEVPMPALIRLLQDDDFEVRTTAILAIDRMGPKRKEAIPDLGQLLSDRALGSLRGLIATSLGTLGADARPAAVELGKLLHDPDPALRERAALALWRITADTNMVAVLVAELEQASDPQQAARLMNDLTEMGPAAKAAVPILLDKIERTRTQAQTRRPLPGRMPNRYGRTVDVAQAARKALEKIDPETAKALAQSSFKVLDLKEAKLGEDAAGK